jgi:hypothetical protein
LVDTSAVIDVIEVRYVVERVSEILTFSPAGPRL